jgi:hypothetical protein
MIPAARLTESTLHICLVCEFGNMRGDILASIQLLLCRTATKMRLNPSKVNLKLKGCIRNKLDWFLLAIYLYAD